MVNNIWRNYYCTPKNLDPAADQSRCERSPPSVKACHACSRFGQLVVRCDFLEKYAYIIEYWKTKDPAKVKAAQDRWLVQNKKWLEGDWRTPHKVAMIYCQDIGFDVSKLADKMDWDFFDSVECESDNE